MLQSQTTVQAKVVEEPLDPVAAAKAEEARLESMIDSDDAWAVIKAYF